MHANRLGDDTYDESPTDPFYDLDGHAVLGSGADHSILWIKLSHMPDIVID
jgi:hypothetical protein